VSRAAGRRIGRGVGACSAGLLGSALLERRESSSVGVSSNYRAFDCTLRGPDSGRPFERPSVFRLVLARVTAVRRMYVYS